MPSRRLAVVLAAVVLLSGCSMLPGGGGDGGDSPTEQPGPDHHELAFYSHTDGAPYNGTLTVRKGGEVVHEESLEGDGNGTHLDVATFDEPGPYTVVVNTSLPEAGGGTMHEELTVNGTLGNATAITMDYQDPKATTYSLGGDGDVALYLDTRIPEHVEYPMRVAYEGDVVVDTTAEADSTQPFEVASLGGPGVYRVEVQGVNENWSNETVVVTEHGAKIAAHGEAPPELAVYGPDEDVPDDP
jgi:hypothetical protein